MKSFLIIQFHPIVFYFLRAVSQANGFSLTHSHVNPYILNKILAHSKCSVNKTKGAVVYYTPFYRKNIWNWPPIILGGQTTKVWCVLTFVMCVTCLWCNAYCHFEHLRWLENSKIHFTVCFYSLETYAIINYPVVGFCSCTLEYVCSKKEKSKLCADGSHLSCLILLVEKSFCSSRQKILPNLAVKKWRVPLFLFSRLTIINCSPVFPFDFLAQPHRCHYLAAWWYCVFHSTKHG